MAACGFVGSDAFREDASQERPRASFSDEISNDPDINLGATETKTNTYISTMIFTCLGLLRMVEEEVPIVKHFSGKKCQLPATFLAQKGRKVIKRVVPTRINSVILWGNHKNGYSMLWHLQPLFSLALLHKSLQATCWIVVLQAKSSLLLMLSALLSLLHAGSLWQYILFTSGYDLSIYGRLHCCILESMTAAGCFSCF